MARSFQGSDGRIHYYHIQLQEGDDDDGPLVIYLPTTKCESILHPAKSAFSLLTFEMEHVGGVAWKNPFPTWIVDLFRSLRADPRWSNADWFLFGCSRGAAWGLEAITYTYFQNVLLVAPYLQGSVGIDPIRCGKIQQGLDLTRVVVVIGEYDCYKPCDKLMGMLESSQAIIHSLQANHSGVLDRVRLENTWSDLLDNRATLAKCFCMNSLTNPTPHTPTNPTQNLTPNPTPTKSNANSDAIDDISNAEKLRWLREYGWEYRLEYGPIPTVLDVKDNIVSTVFILSSFSPKALKQLENATCMFIDLRFPRIIKVRGIDSEAYGTFPPGNVVPMSSLSWLLVFGPKLLKMVEHLPDDVPLCIAEDSVWPTDQCTPEYLHTVFSHYRSFGFEAVWVGAVKPRKKKDIISQNCPPAGSKLFIATRSLVVKAWEKIRVSHKTMSVDATMQKLVAEGVIAVLPQLLAGSQEHWSARDRQYVGSHTKELPLMGVPLERRIYSSEDNSCM